MRGPESCPLCQDTGGEVLWQDDNWRLVLVGDADYPGFCRVIGRRHVAEMTDLTSGERRALMTVVFCAERALRSVLSPDKINLASLGNQVAHVHWHVIARWHDDRHFPDSVWSVARRDSAPRRALDAEKRQALCRAFLRALDEESIET